jgi:hypothetical protein
MGARRHVQRDFLPGDLWRHPRLLFTLPSWGLPDLSMAAAAAAVNAPVAQLCFGTGTSELNLREVGLHCTTCVPGQGWQVALL